MCQMMRTKSTKRWRVGGGYRHGGEEPKRSQAVRGSLEQTATLLYIQTNGCLWTGYSASTNIRGEQSSVYLIHFKKHLAKDST